MSCFVSKCIYVLCKSSIADIYNELRITKEPLDESEKAGFKLNIQKTKLMASCPITSWQIDGETMETMADFILGGVLKSQQMVTVAMKLKDACFFEENL